MKISKKYILIGLISLLLLFVPRGTYALVSDYYTEWKYNIGLFEKKEEYQTKIDSIKTYLSNNVVSNIDVNDNKRLLMFDMDTIDSSNVLVRIADVSETNNTKIENTYGQYNIYKYFSYYYVFTEVKCIFNNDNLTNCVLNSSGSWFIEYKYSDLSCNPTEENCLIEENKYLFDTTYVSDTYNINFVAQYANNNTYYDIPIKHNNIITLPGISLNYKEYFDSLFYTTPDNFCPEVSNQIGDASYVSEFYFNISGNSNTNDHLKGYIDLYSTEFVGIGINAESFGDITYEWASDNEAENNSFSYTVEWINDYGGANKPAYRINYDIFSGSDENVYTSLILHFKLNQNNVFTYFNQSVYIFSFTYCNPFNVSYGYINYKDNSTVTSDPFLQNYLNNLSLPSLKFFNNLNTLLPVGPIDSILTIPLQMLNSINSALSGTCQPITVNLPYVNRNVTLNCQNSFYNSIGATNFVNFVGIVASVLILIKYFVFLYNWLESVLSLSHQQLSVWGEASVIDPNWETRG